MPTPDFPLYGEDNGGATAGSIREAATEPNSHTTTIQSLVGDLSDDKASVKSEIEGDVADIASASPDAAGKTAQNLARNGFMAVGLINEFADAVETYDGKIKDLNKKLHERTNKRYNADMHDPDVKKGDVDPPDKDAIKAQVKAELDGDFKDAKKALDNAEGAAVSGFENGPSDAEVRRLMLAGYIPLESRTLWPNIKLSPQQVYDAYRKGIDNGTLTDFKDMTEGERKAFLKEEPGLLKFLMGKDKPSAQEKNDVLALAVPHVDGEDGKKSGQSVLDALDDKATPEDFSKALVLMGEFGAYTKWAQEHGGPKISSDQTSYLKEFYGRVGDKTGDIKDYINDDKHRIQTGTAYNPYTGNYPTYKDYDGFSDGEKDTLFKNFANGMLTLSDEDHTTGGGWDALPPDVRDAVDHVATRSDTENGPIYHDNGDFKDLANILVRGDVAAGDDLSKHLAVTVQRSTANYDETAFGDSGMDWDDELSGKVLGLVSHNHEATTDLLIGAKDGMPGGYDHNNFLKTVYNHDWDDDGKGAASLTNWIHTEQADPDGDHALADKAFNGLGKSLTSVGDDGLFKDLMGEGSDAAGKRNPELVNSLLAATTDHFGEFEVQDGKPGSSPLDEASRVRLMSLMASDPDTATKMAGAIQIHQAQNTDSWASDPAQVKNGLIDLADRNSRLSTYLDASLINEASERGLDAQEAEDARVACIKTASGMVASLAGPASGPAGPVVGPMAGVGNTLLANLLSADHIPDPAPHLDPQWTAQGGHVTTSNGLNVVRSLVDNNYIDESEIPEALKNPANATDAQVHQAVTNLLQKKFPDQPTLYTDFNTEVENSYDSDLDHLSLKGKDDEKVKAFRSDESWPT